MERSKEEWRQWFRVCMLLTGHGFIPGDPRTRNVCGRAEVIDRWGPAVEYVEGVGGPCRGYDFRDEDGEEYHLYVLELFQRVHQRKLQRRVLPFHFARGLAMEASGGSVNWVAFAMNRCFPRHKRSPFLPLTEYASVNTPLPWTHVKVLPQIVEVGRPRPVMMHAEVRYQTQYCTSTGN